MFCGEIKEKGDETIQDASTAAYIHPTQRLRSDVLERISSYISISMSEISSASTICTLSEHILICNFNFQLTNL